MIIKKRVKGIHRKSTKMSMFRIWVSRYKVSFLRRVKKSKLLWLPQLIIKNNKNKNKVSFKRSINRMKRNKNKNSNKVFRINRKKTKVYSNRLNSNKPKYRNIKTSNKIPCLYKNL